MIGKRKVEQLLASLLVIAMVLTMMPSTPWQITANADDTYSAIKIKLSETEKKDRDKTSLTEISDEKEYYTDDAGSIPFDKGDDKYYLAPSNAKDLYIKSEDAEKNVTYSAVKDDDLQSVYEKKTVEGNTTYEEVKFIKESELYSAEKTLYKYSLLNEDEKEISDAEITSAYDKDKDDAKELTKDDKGYFSEKIAYAKVKFSYDGLSLHGVKVVNDGKFREYHPDLTFATNSESNVYANGSDSYKLSVESEYSGKVKYSVTESAASINDEKLTCSGNNEKTVTVTARLYGDTDDTYYAKTTKDFTFKEVTFDVDKVTLSKISDESTLYNKNDIYYTTDDTPTVVLSYDKDDFGFTKDWITAENSTDIDVDESGDTHKITIKYDNTLEENKKYTITVKDKTFAFKVDSTAPTADIAIKDNKIEITNVKEDESGIKSVKAKFADSKDDFKWSDVTSLEVSDGKYVSDTATGSHQVAFVQIVDNAGNKYVYPSDSDEKKYSKTEVAYSVDVDPDENSDKSTKTRYYNKEVTVTIKVKNIDLSSNEVTVNKNGIDTSVEWTYDENTKNSTADIKLENGDTLSGLKTSIEGDEGLDLTLLKTSGADSRTDIDKWVVDTEAPTLTLAVEDGYYAVKGAKDRVYIYQTTSVAADTDADKYVDETIEKYDVTIKAIIVDDNPPENSNFDCLTVSVKSGDVKKKSISLTDIKDLAGNYYNLPASGQTISNETNGELITLNANGDSGAGKFATDIYFDAQSPYYVITDQKFTLTQSSVKKDIYTDVITADICFISDDSNNDGSGIKSCEASVSEAGSFTVTTPERQADSDDDNDKNHYQFTISPNGNVEANDVVVSFVVTDNVGNKRTFKKTFNFDNKAPAITASYNNNDSVNSNEYYNADRTLTVTVEDMNFDPDNTTLTMGYQADSNLDATKQISPNISSEWIQDGNKYTKTIECTGDGIYTFSMSTTDKVGNTVAADSTDTNKNNIEWTDGTTSEWKFVIDKTAPVVNLTIDDSSKFHTDDKYVYDYSASDVTITAELNETNIYDDKTKVTFNITRTGSASAADETGYDEGKSTGTKKIWSVTLTDDKSASASKAGDTLNNITSEITDLAGNKAEYKLSDNNESTDGTYNYIAKGHKPIIVGEKKPEITITADDIVITSVGSNITYNDKKADDTNLKNTAKSGSERYYQDTHTINVSVVDANLNNGNSYVSYDLTIDGNKETKKESLSQDENDKTKFTYNIEVTNGQMVSNIQVHTEDYATNTSEVVVKNSADAENSNSYIVDNSAPTVTIDLADTNEIDRLFTKDNDNDHNIYVHYKTPVKGNSGEGNTDGTDSSVTLTIKIEDANITTDSDYSDKGYVVSKGNNAAGEETITAQANTTQSTTITKTLTVSVDSWGKLDFDFVAQDLAGNAVTAWDSVTAGASSSSSDLFKYLKTKGKATSVAGKTTLSGTLFIDQKRPASYYEENLPYIKITTDKVAKGKVTNSSGNTVDLYDDSVTFKMTVGDENSGLNTISWSVNDSNINSAVSDEVAAECAALGGKNLYTVDIPLTVNDDYENNDISLEITVSDLAGNTIIYTENLAMDNYAPRITVTADDVKVNNDGSNTTYTDKKADDTNLKNTAKSGSERYYQDTHTINVSVVDLNLNNTESEKKCYITYDVTKSGENTSETKTQTLTQDGTKYLSKIEVAIDQVVSNIQVHTEDNAKNSSEAKVMNPAKNEEPITYIVENTPPEVSVEISSDNVTGFYTNNGKVYIQFATAASGVSGASASAGADQEVALTLTITDNNITTNADYSSEKFVVSGKGIDLTDKVTANPNTSQTVKFTKTIKVKVDESGAIPFSFIAKDLAGNCVNSWDKVAISVSKESEGKSEDLSTKLKEALKTVGKDGETLSATIVTDQNRPSSNDKDNESPVITMKPQIYNGVTVTEVKNTSGDTVNLYSKSMSYKMTVVDPQYTYTDQNGNENQKAYSGLKSVSWTIKDSGNFSGKGSAKLTEGDQEVKDIEVPVKVGDNYENNDIVITVTAVDMVGNTTTYTQKLAIDNYAPRITASYDNNSVQNGKYFNDYRTLTVSVEDLNFDPDNTTLTMKYDKDSSLDETKQVEPEISDTWTQDGNKYTKTIKCSEEGIYNFSMSSKDKAENTVKADNTDKNNKNIEWADNTTAKWDFVIDKTAPVVNLTIDDSSKFHTDDKYVYDYSASDVTITAQLTDTNIDANNTKFAFNITRTGKKAADETSYEKNTTGTEWTWSVTLTDDKETSASKAGDTLNNITSAITDLAGNPAVYKLSGDDNVTNGKYDYVNTQQHKKIRVDEKNPEITITADDIEVKYDNYKNKNTTYTDKKDKDKNLKNTAKSGSERYYQEAHIINVSVVDLNLNNTESEKKCYITYDVTKSGENTSEPKTQTLTQDGTDGTKYLSEIKVDIDQVVSNIQVHTEDIAKNSSEAKVMNPDKNEEPITYIVENTPPEVSVEISSDNVTGFYTNNGKVYIQFATAASGVSGASASAGADQEVALTLTITDNNITTDADYSSEKFVVSGKGIDLTDKVTANPNTSQTVKFTKTIKVKVDESGAIPFSFIAKDLAGNCVNSWDNVAISVSKESEGKSEDLSTKLKEALETVGKVDGETLSATIVADQNRPSSNDKDNESPVIKMEPQIDNGVTVTEVINTSGDTVNLYSKSMSYKMTVVDPQYTYTDQNGNENQKAYSGLSSVTWEITDSKDKSDKTKLTSSGGSKNLNGTQSKDFTVDVTVKDKYENNDIVITVTAVDMVGNKTTYTQKLAIDNYAPRITASYDNNSVQNDKYYNADRTLTVTVEDLNFVPANTTLTMKYDKDSSLQVEPEISDTWTQDGNKYTKTITCSGEGSYNFSMSSTDKADNKVEAGSSTKNITWKDDTKSPWKFVIDKTAPVVNLTIPDKTASANDYDYYKSDVTITAKLTDTNIDANNTKFAFNITRTGKKAADETSYEKDTTGTEWTWSVTLTDDKETSASKAGDTLNNITSAITDLAGNPAVYKLSGDVDVINGKYDYVNTQQHKKIRVDEKNPEITITADDIEVKYDNYKNKSTTYTDKKDKDKNLKNTAKSGSERYYQKAHTIKVSVVDLNLNNGSNDQGKKVSYISYKLTEDGKTENKTKALTQNSGSKYLCKIKVKEGQMVSNIKVVTKDYVTNSSEATLKTEKGKKISYIVDNTKPKVTVSVASGDADIIYVNKKEDEAKAYIKYKTPASGKSEEDADKGDERKVLLTVTITDNNIITDETYASNNYIVLGKGVEVKKAIAGDEIEPNNSQTATLGQKITVELDASGAIPFSFVAKDLAGNCVNSWKDVTIVDPKDETDSSENLKNTLKKALTKKGVGKVRNDKKTLSATIVVDQYRPSTDGKNKRKKSQPVIEMGTDEESAYTIKNDEEKGNVELYNTESMSYSLHVYDPGYSYEDENGQSQTAYSGLAEVSWTVEDSEGKKKKLSKTNKLEGEKEKNYTVNVSVGDDYEDNDIKIRVTAVDKLGNTTKYTKYLAIDNYAPRVTAVYDNNEAENDKYFNKERKLTLTITDLNFDEDEVKAVAKDNGKDKEINWKSTGKDNEYQAVITYTGGHCTFDLNDSYDSARNKFNYNKIDWKDTTSSGKNKAQDDFIVDDKAPEITLEGLKNGSANTGEVSPVITITDDYFNEKNYSCEITVQQCNGSEVISITEDEITIAGKKYKKGDKKYEEYIKDLQLSTDKNGRRNGVVITLNDLAHTEGNDGLYELKVTATDLAGNESDKIQIKDDTGKVIDKDLKEVNYSLNRTGTVFVIEKDSDTDKIRGQYKKSEELPEQIMIEAYSAVKITSATAYINNNKLSLDQEITDSNQSTVKTGYRIVQKGSNSGSDTKWWHYRYIIDKSNLVSNSENNITIIATDESKKEWENHSSLHKEDASLSFCVDDEAPYGIIEVAGMEADALGNKTVKADEAPVAVTWHDNFNVGSVCIKVKNKNFKENGTGEYLIKNEDLKQLNAVKNLNFNDDGEGEYTLTGEDLKNLDDREIEFLFPQSSDEYEVTIVVTDAAGNEYEESEKFMVNTNSFILFIHNKVLFIGSIILLLLLILLILFLVKRRRDKEKEKERQEKLAANA